MSFPFFLARRFYNSAGCDKKRRASRLAIRIATAGVALGLAVMLISICVVKGYQREIKERLVGFASHIEILDRNSLASPESFPIVTDGTVMEMVKQMPEIGHVQRVSLKMGIIKTEDAFQTIVLKGVGKEYNLSFLKKHLVAGRIPDFTADSAANAIIISRKQADAMHLGLGDRVYTYFISDDIKLRRFRIEGIYETHLAQFDTYYIWTGQSVVNQLNNWQEDQSSSLEIALNDFSRLDEVQARLARSIGTRSDRNGANYSTLSVKENPRTAATFEWLALLDFNVWVILVLMMGVAGFTMISGLLILILERTRIIGVLKALGACNSRIRHTFILYAVLIVVRGLVWGNAIGLGIVALQNYFKPFRLDPSTYYVDAVPVEVDWTWVVGLNAATLLVTVLALVVPSFVISRIQPARAIRFE